MRTGNPIKRRKQRDIAKDRVLYAFNSVSYTHLGGVEYATVCPLALAVLRLTGVHISSRIPAGMIVSPLGT